jgi:hypothetical protein
MPGFDGTGPAGQGPMTGGGRGYCAKPVGGTVRPLRGGYGMRGGGRGWRNCFYATGLPGWMRARPSLSKEDELSALKKEEEYLKGELETLHSRINELETK